jgi:Heterokaryon incompatibility protein (HET)
MYLSVRIERRFDIDIRRSPLTVEITPDTLPLTFLLTGVVFLIVSIPLSAAHKITTKATLISTLTVTIVCLLQYHYLPRIIRAYTIIRRLYKSPGQRRGRSSSDGHSTEGSVQELGTIASSEIGPLRDEQRILKGPQRSSYQYQPLRGDEIRLLELELPSESKHIQCKMEHISLRKAMGRFDALSYRWGDPAEPKRWIHLDDKELKVTGNLESALQLLKLPEGTKLWVWQ